MLRETHEQNWLPCSRSGLAIGDEGSTHAHAEEVLRYFMCTCKHAIADMQPLKRATLTAKGACTAAEAVVLCKGKG